MKILRVTNKTRADRIRKEDIWELCGVENVCNWVSLRRREWNERVTRVRDSRAVNVVWDTVPAGRRHPGRPRKRRKVDITPT
jgi:hypothetical protein